MIIINHKTFESCPLCGSDLKYVKSYDSLALYCENNLSKDFNPDIDYLRAEYFILYNGDYNIKYNGFYYLQFSIHNYRLVIHYLNNRVQLVIVNSLQKSNTVNFDSIENLNIWLNQKDLKEQIEYEFNLS